MTVKNSDLWLTRWFYFLTLGGTGFIAPFLNLFYVRVGLSGTDIGIVAALGAIVALIAAPVWTSTNRQRLNSRALLQISLLLTALAYLWLGAQSTFLGIVIVATIRSLVGAGISPFSDSLALSVTSARKLGFGNVRVWASMGWVIAVLSGGWIIERMGFGAAFAGVCAVMLLGDLLLLPIAPEHFTRGKTSSPHPNRLATTLRAVLRNRAMVGVGARSETVSSERRGVAQFETVYLSTLGASDTLLGVAGILSAVVEIPCMLWADRLVRKHGTHQLLLIAMGLIAFQRALVLLAPSIQMIMATRALGGLSFSFYVIASTAFISEETQPHETGTVLALFSVTLAGLVNIISAPLAGAAYDAFGARWLYAIAVVGYVAGWVCLRTTRKPSILTKN